MNWLLVQGIRISLLPLLIILYTWQLGRCALFLFMDRNEASSTACLLGWWEREGWVSQVGGKLWILGKAEWRFVCKNFIGRLSGSTPAGKEKDTWAEEELKIHAVPAKVANSTGTQKLGSPCRTVPNWSRGPDLCTLAMTNRSLNAALGYTNISAKTKSRQGLLARELSTSMFPVAAGCQMVCHRSLTELRRSQTKLS